MAKSSFRSGPQTSRAEVPRASVQRRFDLLLRGGRVLSPADHLDNIADVGVKDGKIVAIAANLPREQAANVRDATGLLVLPGLIDTHAHIFEYVSGDFGLNADDVGIRSGVTAVVDQGGPSALTIDGFRKFVVESSRSQVYCFISAYLAGGLQGHRYVDLYGPSGINVDAVVAAARRNPDIVRGIKVHCEPGGYSRWGMDSLKLAKKASRELGLPIYIHLGTLWPEADGKKIDPNVVIQELVPLIDKDDILAHPFTRHPSGFVSSTGEVHPVVFEALGRGVRIDVGHGSHFSFKTAKAVVAAGIVPFTLGADMHGYNVGKADNNGGTWQEGGPDASSGNVSCFTYKPTFSLYTAMSELLALGLPIEEIVKMVTANAATMLGAEGKIGMLAVGKPADISAIAVEHGDFIFTDGGGTSVSASHRVHPVFAVKDGKLVDPSSPLLPEAERPASTPPRPRTRRAVAAAE
jgi:dihydroorotase